MKRLFLVFSVAAANMFFSFNAHAQKWIEIAKLGYDSVSDFPEAVTAQGTGVFDTDSLSQAKEDADWDDFLCFITQSLKKDSLPSCHKEFKCVIKRWCVRGEIVHILINPELNLPEPEKSYLRQRTEFIMNNWHSSAFCTKIEKFTDCGHFTRKL